MDKLNEYYQKSLPAMQEQLLISILEGRTAGERAQTLLRTYDLHLESSCYAAALLRGSVAGRNGNQLQLLNLSLIDLMKEYLEGSFRFHCVNYLDQIAVIFLLDDAKQLGDLLYHLDQICKISDRMLGMRTTAAVGQIVYDLLDIAASFQEAGNAMEYRAIFGRDSQVIYIGDIEPRPQDSANLPEFNYQDILRAVRLGDRDETTAALHRFIDTLKCRALTPGQYQIACMELLTEFTKLGRSYQLDVRNIFGSERMPWQEIEHFSSLDELENWLQDICTNLRHTLRHERKDSTARLAEEAQKYIEEHYAESELAADSLCRHLNVSAAYFSTVFKREVGLGFAAYLTKVRLEHAIRLLTSTEEKTYVIAEAVGYTEPNYFSYVFKKEYGISPSRYRASLKNEVNG
jgi:two-component system response regulator YesN